LNCIEKLVECVESIDIEEMDCDTYLKMQEILSGEIDDLDFLKFAIENLNIRIHRDITGEMWFGKGRYENLQNIVFLQRIDHGLVLKW
jgi:hypothetical protein